MATDNIDIAATLAAADAGINGYFAEALKQGAITKAQFEDASKKTLPNLRAWLQDPELDRLSPNLKAGVADAVAAARWEDLVNAYRKDLSFGTGGIRGMMAFDRESIVKMKDEGLDARILKGPNTLNNVVVLRVSAGVAQFGRAGGRTFDKIVLGYDSRVRGGDFAKAIAEEFLAFGYTVYLFDEPCPYPMVTYAIPYEKIKAQVGLLISASHNDYRYNGYKLSCGNGSQFDPKQRDEMYDQYIVKATFKDVKRCPLGDAPKGKLWWLGGKEPLPGVDYYGAEGNLINIHEAHANHVKSFLFTKDFSDMNPPLNIGYCPYHGAGRKAVPRMLKEIGLTHIQQIHENGLSDLNGLFPSFCSDPGKEQQPDPGDPRAATIAVNAFKKEYPGEFEKIDLLIGTDPDADRYSGVVKVPKNQQALYANDEKGTANDGSWVLLMSDDMWCLLLWYRLMRAAEAGDTDNSRKFVVYSHTTTDAILKVCERYGVGVIKTWVGFASLSAAVRDQWDHVPTPCLVEGRANPSDVLCHPYICEYYGIDDKRDFNIGTLEQSAGWSLLGGAPKDQFSLGEHGHVRDKDGTFAAILSAEVAAWAKQHGTTLFELVDKHIYLDPAVGLFVNHYEPDPLDGEYPGIEGDRKKMAILNKALELWRAAVKSPGSVEIGGQKVLSAVMYRTGKYDRLYPAEGDFVFPDEGVRFYFSEDKLNHLTVRPSGTGNSLRFHAQLHADVNEGNLIQKKAELRAATAKLADDIRAKLGAPRD